MASPTCNGGASWTEHLPRKTSLYFLEAGQHVLGCALGVAAHGRGETSETATRFSTFNVQSGGDRQGTDGPKHACQWILIFVSVSILKLSLI